MEFRRRLGASRTRASTIRSPPHPSWTVPSCGLCPKAPDHDRDRVGEVGGGAGADQRQVRTGEKDIKLMISPFYRTSFPSALSRVEEVGFIHVHHGSSQVGDLALDEGVAMGMDTGSAKYVIV